MIDYTENYDIEFNINMINNKYKKTKLVFKER